jgi:hypothetical protein
MQVSSGTTHDEYFILPAHSQEVKQNKEEWDVVMDKLERIAGLVDKFGMSCEEYNLEEKDVPRGLRAIFESLVTYVTYPLSSYRWLIVPKRTGWYQACAQTKPTNRRNPKVIFT